MCFYPLSPPPPLSLSGFRGRHQMSSLVILHLNSWDWISHWSWSSLILLDWPVSPRARPAFTPHTWHYTCIRPCLVFWGVASGCWGCLGPHAFTVSILLNEPSFEFHKSFLNRRHLECSRFRKKPNWSFYFYSWEKVGNSGGQGSHTSLFGISFPPRRVTLSELPLWKRDQDPSGLHEKHYHKHSHL